MKSDPTIDPRPDLPEDSQLWSYLLQRSEDKWFWNAVRCAGFRLVQDRGSFILQPTIDNQLGFDNEQAYQEFRTRWMLPRKDEIQETLRKIGATQKVGA